MESKFWLWEMHGRSARGTTNDRVPPFFHLLFIYSPTMAPKFLLEDELGASRVLALAAAPNDKGLVRCADEKMAWYTEAIGETPCAY